MHWACSSRCNKWRKWRAAHGCLGTANRFSASSGRWPAAPTDVQTTTPYRRWRRPKRICRRRALPSADPTPAGNAEPRDPRQCGSCWRLGLALPRTPTPVLATDANYRQLQRRLAGWHRYRQQRTWQWGGCCTADGGGGSGGDFSDAAEISPSAMKACVIRGVQERLRK